MGLKETMEEHAKQLDGNVTMTAKLNKDGSYGVMLKNNSTIGALRVMVVSLLLKIDNETNGRFVTEMLEELVEQKMKQLKEKSND